MIGSSSSNERDVADLEFISSVVVTGFVSGTLSVSFPAIQERVRVLLANLIRVDLVVDGPWPESGPPAKLCHIFAIDKNRSRAHLGEHQFQRSEIEISVYPA